MSLASRCRATGQNRGHEVLARSRVRQGAQVVDERVRPDVRDLVRVPRDRDPPGQALTADREVLQPARDERPRLVRAERRQDEVGPLVVEREQLLLIGREPKEPVALLDPLGLDVVLGALPVDELRLRLERLAAHAVEPRVDVLVDVVATVVPDPEQELLDEPLVPVVARADEEVVGDAEAGGERPPRLDDAIGVLLRLETLLLGHARHLRRMLVDPGEEERVTAALPLMAREDVRGHRRVGVPDVRGGVDVVDRRGDVVRLHLRRFYGRPSSRPRLPGGTRRATRRREHGRCRTTAPDSVTGEAAGPRRASARVRSTECSRHGARCPVGHLRHREAGPRPRPDPASADGVGPGRRSRRAPCAPRRRRARRPNDVPRRASWPAAARSSGAAVGPTSGARDGRDASDTPSRGRPSGRGGYCRSGRRGGSAGRRRRRRPCRPGGQLDSRRRDARRRPGRARDRTGAAGDGDAESDAAGAGVGRRRDGRRRVRRGRRGCRRPRGRGGARRSRRRRRVDGRGSRLDRRGAGACDAGAAGGGGEAATGVAGGAGAGAGAGEGAGAAAPVPPSAAGAGRAGRRSPRPPTRREPRGGRWARRALRRRSSPSSRPTTPSATASPLATPIEPRWTSVTA